MTCFQRIFLESVKYSRNYYNDNRFAELDISDFPVWNMKVYQGTTFYSKKKILAIRDIKKDVVFTYL